MGYRTNELGYPTDVLQSRAIVERGNFAIIPPQGLVKNTLPNFENCELTIMSTPKLGASFVDYLCRVLPGGGNTAGFGGNGIETFLYVLDGELEVSDGVETFSLTTGGYIYVPATKKLTFENKSTQATETFLYKKRYQEVEGLSTDTYVNNSANIVGENYEDMTDVDFQTLLPTDLAFDMNFHILSFATGGSHGYIETHYQEHGALLLSGEGMYNLDNHWIPVKKGDYIFMGAYNLQACYSVGRNAPLSYLYSKDCNRDVDL
ncbi:(S)-ureidoglycine aminohydrolase [Vagococcus penaei]|uniref:(S)-ureidoglycine aminohydrolase n=1 Tax=Vagococcus penaei TaxID=633807 RepID=A0A1Q2D6Y6_9ENTE|nr:(S)-ureidoglycine aminohydrolase [Vagococcus penaei]AQP54144.1 (S)-ureidoglycine aminohydrolase [Vagococcus penaei]RSU02143.1 (S)-ureidoglycine aminohydrolase [Vagococcus penaei]